MISHGFSAHNCSQIKPSTFKQSPARSHRVGTLPPTAPAAPQEVEIGRDPRWSLDHPPGLPGPFCRPPPAAGSSAAAEPPTTHRPRPPRAHRHAPGKRRDIGGSPRSLGHAGWLPRHHHLLGQLLPRLWHPLGSGPRNPRFGFQVKTEESDDSDDSVLHVFGRWISTHYLH